MPHRYGGILPYTVINGTLHFLLAKETCPPHGDGTWCGFGGGRDDNESPLETAVREGWEESMGLLGRAEELRPQLRHFVHHEEGYTYFLYVDPARAPALAQSFDRVVEYLRFCAGTRGCGAPAPGGREGCYEKVAAAWAAVPIDETQYPLRPAFARMLQQLPALQLG
jgi:8-oxo-dGTP pyrophosphatase MutT (NUDIX family)